jgi:hypothetical protein
LKKLDAGQLVSILANIGVIAGIVFLGIEVRQNNAFLAAEARNNLRVQRADMIDAQLDQLAAESIHKYTVGADLSPVERNITHGLALRTVELWEWQFGEYEAGMLRRAELPVEAWKLWYNDKAVWNLPLREVWERRRDALNPRFVDFFEENVVIEQPE